MKISHKRKIQQKRGIASFLRYWRVEEYFDEQSRLKKFKQRIANGENIKLINNSQTRTSSGVSGCDLGDCRKLRNKSISEFKKTMEEQYGSSNVLRVAATKLNWRTKSWRNDWPDNTRHCESRAFTIMYSVVQLT